MRTDHPTGGPYAGLVTFVVVMVAEPDPARQAGPVLAAHGGRMVATGAAGRIAARFGGGTDAVAAALAARAALPATARIAVHAGYALTAAGLGPAAPALRRCERLCEVANPGQILLSAATATTVAGELPAGVSVADLGRHRLRDLAPAERIFELRDADADAAVSGALRSLDSVPNNLPIHLTSFVGRRRELGEVHALMAGGRLVTVTGPGGGGKTRLAAQVAAECAVEWPGGVWWVELAGVTDPAEVSAAAAAAIGALAEPAGRQVRALTAQLRDHQALICLDNCEHVLEGAAELVEAVLRWCPDVSVLATSREPLNLPGEATWQLPPLTGDEAMALFMDRASAVRPYFTVDAAGERAIRSMCARLDGIPLALELAAAWLRTLTPVQVEAGLDDRFALLVRAPRTAAARHQTLAASIDWSHDLLGETERRVFHRLAVFADGFDLDAVLAVGADATTSRSAVMRAFGRLVDMSLVVAEDRAEKARYRLLESIRAYAAGHLRDTGEERAARDRHLDHYLAIAEDAEPELDRDKDAWRARIEPERDNLRTALEWGLAAPDPERGRRLAAALAWLWNLRATGREGLAYLRRAIDLAPRDRSLLQARLLTGYALVADTAAPFDLDAAHQGLALATELGDDRLRGRCLQLTALGQFYVDMEAAWDLSVQAQQVAEAAGDGYGRDGARGIQAFILSLRDRHEVAAPMLAEVVDGLTGRGDRGIAASLLAVWSSSALATGPVELARDLAQRAVAAAEPLGDYHRVGMARGQLATVLGSAGDIGAGLRLLEAVLRLVDSDPDGAWVPGLGTVMGELHRRRGDFDDAVRWLERDLPKAGLAAETFLAAIMLPPYGAALRGAGRLEEAREALDRAVGLARRFDLPRPLSDALEQLGYLAAVADPDRAAGLHHEALAIRLAHGLRLRYLPSLEALAVLLARSGRREEAARTAAAADHARGVHGCPRPPADQPGFAALAADLRADPALESAWDEGRALDLETAVGYVRRMRGARGRPDHGWDSLTPTERDVVRLAVAGLSNPQIGARLFMSRGTVKTHLAHVYAKLGVANRTELASLAAASANRSGDH